MGWDVAGGIQTTDGTEETSTRPRGSSTGWTSEEICDLVFGEYTKDGPSVKEDVKMESNITHPWHHWFSGDREDWYLPWQETVYP